MSTSVLVVGIGNDYRCDDRIGLLVARAVQARERAHVRVLESDGNCTTLLEAWQETRTVILIDAICAGTTPGQIVRLDIHAQRLPSTYPFASSHALGLAETIELARTLRQLPPRCFIYGIEGRNFSSGEELSPEVSRALPLVVEQVIHEACSSAQKGQQDV